MLTILTSWTKAIFVLLAVLAVLDWLRRRDRVRLDVALMLSALAATTIFSSLSSPVPALATWFGTLTWIALITHPYLLLRLIERFHPVVKGIMHLMVSGFVIATALLLLFQVELPTWASLIVVGYLVTAECYGAYLIIKNALSTRGGARWRLLLAGLGTLFLMLSIVYALASTDSAAATLVTYSLALTAALAYYLAFVPPRWLRRIWRQATLQALLRTAAAEASGRSTEQFGRDLAQHVVDVLGASAGMVALWDDRDGGFRTVVFPESAAYLRETLATDNETIAGVWQNHRAVTLTEEDVSAFTQDTRPGSALVVPIVMGKRAHGLLVAFFHTNLLFADDDLHLLKELARYSAPFFEYARLLSQERRQSSQRIYESEKRFEATFEQAAMGICHVSPDGRFIRANQKLCEIVGYSKAELLELTFQDITHPDDLEADLAHVRQVLAGARATYSIEKRYLHKEGSVVWINLTVSLVRDEDENPDYFIRVIEDIIERKQAERALQALNAELEQRVRARTQQLETANNELEAFAYSVSHDLRAPLRAMSGFSRILLDDYGDQLDEIGQEFLQDIVAGSQQMGRLIDDLLEFSRLGRRAMRREEVDLAQLVRSLVEKHRRQAQAEGREIAVHVEDMPLCYGDSALLKQVYANLLENALKFTREREDACIELGAESNDGAVTYYVRDNGIGFDMKYADEVFGVFQRLHYGEEYEGTGVGLANAQRIIHRHNGRIWAEGKVNEGATVYFTLAPVEERSESRDGK